MFLMLETINKSLTTRGEITYSFLKDFIVQTKH